MSYNRLNILWVEDASRQPVVIMQTKPNDHSNQLLLTFPDQRTLRAYENWCNTKPVAISEYRQPYYWDSSANSPIKEVS